MSENKQPTKFIALIGAGYWGKNLLKDLNNIGVLKAICELNGEIINNYKQSYPNIHFTKNWNEILNDKSITAVVIALPAEYHYKFSKEALENDKDVFVEKPLSLNLEEAEHLVNIADERNKILMVGHVLRYHPCVQKIEQLVKNGSIGTLYYINCSRKNLGKIRQHENVLWSFAPHDISLVLSLVNRATPVKINCNGQIHLNHKIHDVTDTYLEFPGNCFAQISVNWLHPFKEQRTTIVGSEGMLVFDDTKPKNEKLSICKKYLSRKPGYHPFVSPSEFKTVDCNWMDDKLPLQLECEHFVHCCQTRETPVTDGKEGLAVLKILDSCRKDLHKTKKTKNETALETKYFSHETAIIGKKAIIKDGSKIWHWTHILGGEIGENCSIGQNCFMAPGSKLGNNCKVQNNISIYSGITCEDNVFLGPSMVFCNDETPRAAYSKNGVYMKTLVKEGASIGANSTILPGITIGKCAFIGAGSVVTKNVPDYAVIIGNPAKQISVIDEKGNIKKML
jgi:UDP-2-acetamido-3-amino-2,3-dideoxy-glucuronate N-acetyltransferase